MPMSYQERARKSDRILKRGVVFGLALLTIGFVVMIALLARKTHSGPALWVELSVSPRQLSRDGIATARARVTKLGGDAATAAGYQYTWSASYGTVLGSGPIVSWQPDGKTGTADISVAVTGPPDLRGAASASVSVRADSALEANRSPSEGWQQDYWHAVRRAKEKAALPGLKPIIDHVSVEKKEVCEGEENLITVGAHTEGHREDAFLHYVIGGKSGRSLPYRPVLHHGKFRPPGISVFGRGGQVTHIPMPEFVVKPCRPQWPVQVTFWPVTNTALTYRFQAKVLLIGDDAAPFAPVSFAWDFGDGITQTTAAPIADHDYAGAPQDTLYTSYLVQVTITGDRGEIAKGRVAFDVRNHAFYEMVRLGRIYFLRDLEPRVAMPGPDGVVRQGVRMWHTHDESVYLTHIERTTHAGQPQNKIDILDVRSIVGTHVVQPGEKVSFELILDPQRDPGVVLADYRIFGSTLNGVPAFAKISVGNPLARPVDESIGTPEDVPNWEPGDVHEMPEGPPGGQSGAPDSRPLPRDDASD
ncbi:MAG: PKD domain-containing protein [Candidatus Schekmanbacteria bacterium]|nr:PKD domain-containing protein [Candidatus Schekmanbacteria bacterium]